MPAYETSPPPHQMDTTLYADVIVPRHIAKAFTYLVPYPLAQTIAIGHCVLVPFGSTVLEGVVISLSNHPANEIQSVSFREILGLAHGGHASTLPAGLFELSRKIAEYYVAPWGQCLRLILPPVTARKTSSERYVATPEGRAALEAGLCSDDLKPTLDRIARRTSGILLSTLQSARQRHSLHEIDALVNKSWIALRPINNDHRDLQNPRRKLASDKYAHQTSADDIQFTEPLPEVDSAWKVHIAHCLHSHHTRKIVLQAPLEHRLTRMADAVQQAYAMKRSSIVLTGEIAKASWLMHLLSRLTNLQVTLAHPSSDAGQWQENQRQTPTVVVGTRSAIFSPLQSIGLIWVEGEEDAALKELQEPRYHAREVACWRAESERALVVLSSAHPSLEAMFDSEAEIHHVPQDIARQPAIELVDLRNESAGTLFSRTLILSMHEALRNRVTVLLFLNRKGYAGTLICRDCGWVSRCDSCLVPLTYYRDAGRMACRYCGRADRLPDLCPSCRTPHMNPVGDGTERVEAEVRRLFPSAKTARLDGDTLRHSASAHALWEGARSGTWDILIGTQALFRRETLPQHGLVGVLQADSGLHIPDFRAAERTYHLLVEAASLARPASAGGRVIIQTRLPTHHSVQALLSGNSRQFYDEELTARRLLHYPPVCHLADLSVTGKDRRIVEDAAKQWGTELGQNACDEEPLMVFGPVPALRKRPKGSQQYRILAKGPALAALSRRIHDSVQKMEQAYRKWRIKFIVDIDPIENG
ncbi:MAG: primosomal protein N' [Nitrospira sp.]